MSNLKYFTNVVAGLGLILSGCKPQLIGNASPLNQASTGSSLQVSSILPTQGSINGGGTITVTGENFDTTTTVTIGTTACTVTSLTSSTSLQCTLGAGAEGIANVSLTNSANQTATLKNSFTFLLADVCAAGTGVQAFDAVQAGAGTPNESPLRTISNATSPSNPTGLMYDSSSNQLIFSGWGSYFSYYTASPWDDGSGHSDTGVQDITALSTVSGTTNPYRGVYDSTNDVLYIADFYPLTNSQPVVSTYSRSSGALIRHFFDSRNTTNFVRGVAYNPTVGEFAVMNTTYGAIDFYSSSSSGSVSPIRSITGANTTFVANSQVNDITYSSTTGQLLLAFENNSDVLAFNWPVGTGNQNLAPNWILAGSNTGFTTSLSTLTINTNTISGNPDLIVFNGGGIQSITFFPLPLSTATGTFNLSPSRTIQGSNTGLNLGNMNVIRMCR